MFHATMAGKRSKFGPHGGQMGVLRVGAFEI
jgi:hypothetical protein